MHIILAMIALVAGVDTMRKHRLADPDATELGLEPSRPGPPNLVPHRSWTAPPRLHIRHSENILYRIYVGEVDYYMRRWIAAHASAFSSRIDQADPTFHGSSSVAAFRHSTTAILLGLKAGLRLFSSEQFKQLPAIAYLLRRNDSNQNTCLLPTQRTDTMP